MKPAAFEYRAPASVEEAVGVLAEWGDEAKVLAGGQSLMPLLALRLARPGCVVDIGRLGADGMGSIAPDASGVLVGALVRQRQAERDDRLRRASPLVAEAIPFIGHTAIRNRGTIGGSASHADPAAELPTAFTAAGATFMIESAAGPREVAAEDFFVGYLTTALGADELLTGIRIPSSASGQGWSFLEFSRRHGDFAIVGVAAGVRLADGGAKVAEARLVLAGVDSAPLRVRAAEDALVGATPSEEAWSAAADIAAATVDPPADLHGSSAYRVHLVRVLSRQALSTAAARAVAGFEAGGGR